MNTVWFAIEEKVGRWQYQSTHHQAGLIEQMEPPHPSHQPKLCFADEAQIQKFLADNSAPRWTNYVRTLRSVKYQNFVYTIEEIRRHPDYKLLQHGNGEGVLDFLLDFIDFSRALPFDFASQIRRQPRWGSPYLSALQTLEDPNRLLIMEHLKALSLRRELEDWDTFMAHDPVTSDCVWSRYSLKMPDEVEYAMAALPDSSGLRLMKPSTFGHTFSTPAPETLRGTHPTLYVPIPDALAPIIHTFRQKPSMERTIPFDVLHAQLQGSN